MAEQYPQQRSTNGAVAQVRDFFSALTRPQLFAIIGVTVFALAGLLALIVSSSQPDRVVLFSDLSQKDAAMVTDKLKERNVEYQLADDGTTVMIPADVLHETRIALAAEGIPESGTVGYELFDRTNLGMSDFVQKLNYRRALEGELAKTISSLTEIKSARVHLTIPEKTLFSKDQQEPTASVVLELKNGKRLSQLNTEGIQNLVAGSVEGLSIDQVTVIDQKGKLLSDPPRDKNSLAGLSSTQYEQKQKVDEYLSYRVQSLLDQVLGVGNSVVRVNADLDFSQLEKTIEDFDPDRQVLRSEQQFAEKNKSTDSLDYPNVSSEGERGNTISNYEISKTVQKLTEEVGRMKRVTIAAWINGKMQKTTLEDGTVEQKYVERTEEEITQIRQLLRNAVGYDPSRNDDITVVNIPFDTSVDALPDAGGPFALNLTTEELIEKGVLVVVMLLAIFMIRRMVSSPQVRRRIEQVLAPSDLDKQRSELAKAAAERQRALLKELSDDKDLLALPELTSMEDMAARARAQLDIAADNSEESLMKQEIKNRVQNYFEQKPDEAVKLVRSMLRHTPQPAAAASKR